MRAKTSRNGTVLDRICQSSGFWGLNSNGTLASVSFSTRFSVMGASTRNVVGLPVAASRSLSSPRMKFWPVTSMTTSALLMRPSARRFRKSGL